MTDEDWDLLLGRIETGSCTPFLGAGACSGTLPLGSDVARRWAGTYAYPLEDAHDLPRVAQFLAVRMDDAMFPKELMGTDLQGLDPPDFRREDEPHGTLAKLPIPVYLTTNYDDFMLQALRRAGKRPRRELCRWNKLLREAPSVFDGDGFVATVDEPVVYHLHGASPSRVDRADRGRLPRLPRLRLERSDVLPPRSRKRFGTRHSCSSATASPTGTSACSTAASSRPRTRPTAA